MQHIAWVADRVRPLACGNADRDRPRHDRESDFGRALLYACFTIFGQPSGMPDDPETRLTLRQVDQARTDFAEILDEFQVVKAQRARLPTRTEVYRLLLTAIGTTTAIVGALFLWFALATPMSGCPRWTVAAALREHQLAGHYYVPPSERGCEPH
jgi:hypothetical protein